jgi:hypothetical protein
VLASNWDILLTINSLQQSLSGKDPIIILQCNKADSSIKAYQILPTALEAHVEVIGNLSPYTTNTASSAMIKSADFDFPR